MTYQVLARKWRPRDFSEVVGQEHVVQALANALDQNKIHQAYVLSGTRGVGKTTCARIFAQLVNKEFPDGEMRTFPNWVIISFPRFPQILEISLTGDRAGSNFLQVMVAWCYSFMVS